MSEESLHIAEKGKDARGKGERESYTRLSAEFQRITRRDKKSFLSNQCKETEERLEMGKTLVERESCFTRKRNGK